MNRLIKAAEGVGDSLMKAADAMEEKYFIWTTVWTLPSLGEGLDPAVPPILWLRHDRPNETVHLFMNDDLVCSRIGHDQRKTKPTDRFGGEVETVEFTAAGRSCKLEIVYEATKLKRFGQVGRAFAGDKIQYHLTVDGETFESDREGSGRLPPPGQSGLHERVSIAAHRQVSKRVGGTSEMDWKAETVVEYAIHMRPPAGAGGAQEEGPGPLVRWARYSEFSLLHSDVCSCFATVAPYTRRTTSFEVPPFCVDRSAPPSTPRRHDMATCGLSMA